MSTRREMITHSSTADFSEEGGFDQDAFKEECLIKQIMNHHEVENTVLMNNDQGYDDEDIDLHSCHVEIDDMSDPSCVEYTIYALVDVYEEESEWDDDSEEDRWGAE